MSGLDFSDFDRFCDERGVARTGIATAEAFADWLAQSKDMAVIGGPVGEAPCVMAVPDGS